MKGVFYVKTRLIVDLKSHIELAKLTGHKDLKSLMHYAHIAPEHSSGLVAKTQDTVLVKVKK